MNQQNKKETWISAEGEGKLKLSEKEAMTHINASIVRANVSNTFALYTNECIVSMSFIQEESYYFDTSSSSAIAIFPSSSSLLFC
jgi:hypothetical protein